MSDFHVKLLEIFLLPLLILASAVGAGVFLKQHKERIIIVLFFILAMVTAYGISMEYQKLLAARHGDPERISLVSIFGERVR